VRHEEGLDDAGVARMLEQSRFSLLPSLAEGCGLPVLESLWNGVPVFCSDLPALRETADGGGCRVVRAGDAEALLAGMRELLVDDAAITRLTAEACARGLPTWLDAGRAVLAALA
jgi:glycosyltransferase involved in cell wall biosynthesis